MSDAGATETATLLPTATVDIFIRDSETIESARALLDDWRFARVNVNVQEGDVENAIGAYKETQSPALVIIETDTTDESFAGRLGELSNYCSEGTSAIIIGPTNDVNLYRTLVSMGVTDYLVRPVPLATLSEVVAKSLVEQLGAAGSRLIAMIGSKGGVGASSLAQAMAWGLSDQLDQKTFLLDAAGGWSTLGVGMGFEPSTTLHEAVRAASNNDEGALNRMLYKASDKLTVLASGAESMIEPSVHAQQYEELLDMALTSYPVVLADLSAAIPSLKRTVINRAHQIFVVATPTLPALRAARTLIKEIKAIRGGSAEGTDLIVNMQGFSPSKEVPIKDIAIVLECIPSAIIPFEPKLFVGAESESRKLDSDKSGFEIIKMLLPLLAKVVNGPAHIKEREGFDYKGLFGDLLSKISTKS